MTELKIIGKKRSINFRLPDTGKDGDMTAPILRVIVDFDGTLTAEEDQVEDLAHRELTALADEILNVPYTRLASEYAAMRSRLLAAPRDYSWQINGLRASYCDEGGFILNTVTLQEMLRGNPDYFDAVARAFPDATYDPVADCANYLFHTYTAQLHHVFRPAARPLLNRLLAHPRREPVILTNSLGDKVRRQLESLELDAKINILGDTRQYEMDPDWKFHFDHPELGRIQVWPLGDGHEIDLRRPAYYQALKRAAADGARLAVVADTFSLPGALPLTMGIPFFLARTPYSPDWCLRAVEKHPCGQVLEDLGQLLPALDTLDT
jgi:hypothetical protein